MLREYFFGAETLETVHAEMLSLPVLSLVVYQAIKIFLILAHNVSFLPQKLTIGSKHHYYSA